MTRLRTLHKRRKRILERKRRLFKAYLYQVAMDKIVVKQTWEIEKVEETGLVRLFYVNDDWPRGLCRVRIKTSYKDKRGTFYCVFPMAIEMAECELIEVWQDALLARVPYMMVNFLIAKPTKVKELKPIVKRYYK